MDINSFDTLLSEGESDFISDNMDKERVKESIKILANNHWHVIDELESGHPVNDNYHYLKGIISKANEFDIEYIKKIINKQYKPLILRGTVGAYIFACSYGSYGDITSNCSPLCLNNVGHGECSYQIWERPKKSENYIRINTGHRSEAYVFAGETFDGFLEEDVKNMKLCGVSSVYIYTGDDNNHSLVNANIKISDVKIKKLPDVEENTTNPTIKIIQLIVFFSIISSLIFLF